MSSQRNPQIQAAIAAATNLSAWELLAPDIRGILYVIQPSSTAALPPRCFNLARSFWPGCIGSWESLVPACLGEGEGAARGELAGSLVGRGQRAWSALVAA